MELPETVVCFYDGSLLIVQRWGAPWSWRAGWNSTLVYPYTYNPEHPSAASPSPPTPPVGTNTSLFNIKVFLSQQAIKVFIIFLAFVFLRYITLSLHVLIAFHQWIHGTKCFPYEATTVCQNDWRLWITPSNYYILSSNYNMEQLSSKLLSNLRWFYTRVTSNLFGSQGDRLWRWQSTKHDQQCKTDTETARQVTATSENFRLRRWG